MKHRNEPYASLTVMMRFLVPNESNEQPTYVNQYYHLITPQKHRNIEKQRFQAYATYTEKCKNCLKLLTTELQLRIKTKDQGPLAIPFQSTSEPKGHPRFTLLQLS